MSTSTNHPSKGFKACHRRLCSEKAKSNLPEPAPKHETVLNRNDTNRNDTNKYPK